MGAPYLLVEAEIAETSGRVVPVVVRIEAPRADLGPGNFYVAGRLLPGTDALGAILYPGETLCIGTRGMAAIYTWLDSIGAEPT